MSYSLAEFSWLLPTLKDIFHSMSITANSGHNILCKALLSGWTLLGFMSDVVSIVRPVYKKRKSAYLGFENSDTTTWSTITPAENKQ